MFESASQEFMLEALALAEQSVANGGGPFGAVIVKDGKIIGRGTNTVTQSNDPTAHAEVNAIRESANTLQNFDLTGCDLYTSCEPCPMCLGAIYWARMRKVFYGNTREDAKRIGFDDSFIYDQIDLSPEKRTIPSFPFLSDAAAKAFQLWDEKEDKIPY